MFDLLNKADREAFVQEADMLENKIRKAESLKAFEVYNDRIDQYVIKYLKSQYSPKTVLEMPIISSVNLCKRVATKEASLYKTAPNRDFTNLTEEQKNELLALYEDAEVNQKLFKSNVFYKIQGQNFIQVLPKNGDIEIKVIMPHHLDVVPNEINPEEADAYVVNSFDKAQWIRFDSQKSDNQNQHIADADDYRSTLKRYVAWTKDNNFIFNGKGEMIAEVLENPIGELPFVDVSTEKDFEFFVRVGQTLVDFTVQYNGALSDLAQVVKMQGWAVAYLKANRELMPEALTIGPTKLLRIPIDPNNQSTEKSEFGFASPNPDVAGSIQHIENLLSNFLTSRGLDPSIVNGKAQVVKYNSGIDRLLAMVESLESTKQDEHLFQCVEEDLFCLIKKWSQVTYGTDQQFLSFAIPEDAEINVAFVKPNMVQSQSDLLKDIQLKLELGLATKQMAIEELYDMNPDQAEELLQKIEADIALSSPKEKEFPEPEPEQSEAQLSNYKGDEGLPPQDLNAGETNSQPR